ncbi:glycosyltransferase [Microvirga soli]|uniref:glycosyltransferase n=1 Tax=Microvirga soli TaxID=1854496 RepID=UPI00191D61B5|nr:glycosyltransferase [Microvirga soli]
MPFVTHELNAFLSDDFTSDSGGNIGSAGENLTISFLSLNRVWLSERLCASIAECIPEFAGEVVAIDNGSSPQEVKHLREVLARMPYRTRLVELGENRGVAGGRNATIPHVKTKWLMCLDNDIYFISNPLKRIQSDIAALGCRFLSLPLLEPDRKNLFAMGGMLHVSYDDAGHVSVSGGSAYRPTTVDTYDAPGFLSSFVFGGACVFDVEAFKAAGGYDEALFIGFEDTDFSIRLFRMGYKVGTTGAIALVHDHPPPASSNDTDYEKRRFSNEIIKKSALHLEKKYGYKFWDDGTQSWLVKRQADLGLEVASHKPLAATARSKPNIALVVDVEDWAFHNIATQVQRNLKDKFDFDIIPLQAIDDDLFRLMLMMEGYDAAHFFWRQHLHALAGSYVKQKAASFGFDLDELHKRYLANRPITTSVYDHLFLEPNQIEERMHVFQSVTGYSVSSERLNRIYSNIIGYPQPSAVLTDGVDLERFRPAPRALSTRADRPLVVGWAGNSAWSSEIEDFKGFRTLLAPAIEELAAEGVPLTGHFADKQIRMIPHREMPEYYSQIDVFVCSSKIEGTPNPVLEAMACGVPVISTDVGIVPEVFGTKQRDFILQQRTKDCLKQALRRLHENRGVLKELSEENLSSIQAWAWAEKARLFGPFFEGMISKFHESKPSAG